MTTYGQLELLYNQFDNLSLEIETLINEENYENAISKISQKDKLIKKLAMAVKTAEISDEQKDIVVKKNETISKKNKELIERLQIIHKELGEERARNKQQLKMKSAYETNAKEVKSIYIDTEE